MAWIESHQSLGTHIKLRRLARLLGICRATAVGHLHYLWWWTLDNAPSGDVSTLSADEIAEAAEWSGDAETFAAALRNCGWLDPDGKIHDWTDYAGRIVALREGNRKRQKKFRKSRKQARVTRDKGVTSRTSNGADGGTRNGTVQREVTGLPNPTQPNRTQPNQTVPECVPQTVRVQQANAPPPEGTHTGDAHADSSWPVLGEVLTRAQVRGIPEDCARKWWLEHDARGGCDRHGQPLRRWESALIAFASSWRAVDNQQRARKEAAPDHSKGFFG